MSFDYVYVNVCVYVYGNPQVRAVCNIINSSRSSQRTVASLHREMGILRQKSRQTKNELGRDHNHRNTAIVGTAGSKIQIHGFQPQQPTNGGITNTTCKSSRVAHKQTHKHTHKTHTHTHAHNQTKTQTGKQTH